MAKNYNGVQINQSVTIAEKAGAAITDCRNKLLAYDSDGNVVLATDGTKPIVGIAIIEAGINDISGAESGKVAVGDDVDIQIKDIGYAIASAAIAKGAEVTATTGGLVKTATAGEYVVGVALSAATAANDYVRVQISKYQKADGDSSGVKLSDLADVDLSTPATDGQVLKYDGTATKWKAGNDAIE